DLAALDAWMKEIAPSHALRRWFAHDPAKWDAFQDKYKTELSTASCIALINTLHDLAQSQDVTLLFSAKSDTQNNAVVLRQVLEAQR
ncbi:MAG: DUF488 domain-containing protein, partial [Henriciella sp.]